MGKESSPKPKKRQNNSNNNKDKVKKMTEPVLRQERKEGKEKKTTRPRSTENNKGPIRTGVGATQPGRSCNLNRVQLLSGRSSHLSSIKHVQEYHISFIYVIYNAINYL